MFVWGVSVPLAAVAELAGCLGRAGHRDLAMYVGLAVDKNRAKLYLTAYEREQVIDTLADCPASLTALRNALEGPGLAVPNRAAYR